MCEQAEQCLIFPSDPFSWSNVWVMSGSKRASKLHGCSTHRIPFPYSRPPANQSSVCKWGEGSLYILELECRVRTEQLGAQENNALVFGKINTLIKIIQQQWNWEYGQTHNFWEYMCLSHIYRKEVISENNESQRKDSFFSKNREKEWSSWTEDGVCRCLVFTQVNVWCN